MGITETFQNRIFLNQSVVYSFLGIEKLQVQTKRFVLHSSCLSWSYAFVRGLTNTIFILYALENLLPNELGIILALQFIVQGVTDYPTGALGDWIGQRWILATSAFCYTIGFLFLSQATSFSVFLLASIIIALANSQQSGAYSAWFDNNYKMRATEDPEKKIYMEFMGKSNMIYMLLFAGSIITGGIVASLFGRAFTFFFQGLLTVIFIFLFLGLLRNHQSIQRKNPNFKEYFSLLKEGVRVSWNNRTLRMILCGVLISSSIISVWGNLMLLPFYESYAKTDDMIGIMRSLIYLVGAIVMFGLASVSKKIQNHRKWLAISSLIGFPFFYCCVLILSITVPSTLEFNLISYIVVLVVFMAGSMIMRLSDVLMPRFYLELIPDKNRNSIYSLQPTLILLGSVLTVLVGGSLIEVISTPLMIILIIFGVSIGSIVTAKGIANNSN